MQARKRLLVSMILVLSVSAAHARCPDASTAPLGYKYEDSTGGTADVNFAPNSTGEVEQTVIYRNKQGDEIRSRNANKGQIRLESTTISKNGIFHQLNTYPKMPDAIETIGKSDEFGYTVNMQSGASFQRNITKRKAVAAERVAVGECAYDTIVLIIEREELAAGGFKSTIRMNWSPILAHAVKIEGSSFYPGKEPNVISFVMTKIGF